MKTESTKVQYNMNNLIMSSWIIEELAQCNKNIKIRFCKILSLIVSRSSDSVVSYAIWRAVTNGSCELCYTREETKMWAWEEVCAAIPFKGSFFNYVWQTLHIIDHSPTPSWYWGINFFIVIRKNLHYVDISSITYLPLLVNVVKERPLADPHEHFKNICGNRKEDYN